MTLAPTGSLIPVLHQAVGPTSERRCVMAKKRKTYTADEMRELKARLISHKGTLVREMCDLRETFERTGPADQFDVAILLRDVAQKLVSTCNAITIIADHIELAEMKCGAQSVAFDLEDYGL